MATRYDQLKEIIMSMPCAAPNLCEKAFGGDAGRLMCNICLIKREIRNWDKKPISPKPEKPPTVSLVSPV